MTQLETGNDLEALQRENSRLRSQVAEHEVEKKARAHPWRRAAIVVVIVLGCLVLALANVAFWVKHTALNTNGWVAAVGPLSQNPVIVDGVSGYVVDELYTALDVEQLTYEALPEEYKGLSQPLSGVVRSLANETVAMVIESDEFHEVWLAVNRTAHRTVVAILRGDGSLVTVRDGQVTVDLGDLFGSIQDRLGIKDLDLLSEEDTQFVLFGSERLAGLQRTVAVIDTVGLVLPVVTLLIFCSAWLLSLTRRRTLLRVGAGVAITMLLSLFLFDLVKPAVLAPIGDPLVQTVAGKIWGTVTRTLTVQTVLLLGAGLLLAFGAWFAGPSSWAVETRSDIRAWWDGRKKE